MARYVSSDWHGQIKLANQIFDFLQPDDELYFLGDACDRGPAGLEIMQRLLNDKRVTYLKGNHEDMVTICVPEFLNDHYEDMWWWCDGNGGQSTWDAIGELPQPQIKDLINKLNSLPKRIDLVNNQGKEIILTHAGTDPDMSERDWELFGVKDPYLWNRKHINHIWRGGYDTVVIHGHTPIQPGWIPEYKNEDQFTPTVTFYCQNHKIDIDLGAFFSGRTALLNLDTFEVIYFEAKPEGDWEEYFERHYTGSERA